MLCLTKALICLENRALVATPRRTLATIVHVATAPLNAKTVVEKASVRVNMMTAGVFCSDDFKLARMISD